MLNSVKSVFLTLIVFLSFTQAYSQITTADTNVVINTKYKPDVAESNKIDIQPTLEDPKVDPPSYSYLFPQIDYKPKSVYTPINPVFIKPEQKEDLFENYIEIGGGNYLTSYLNASIHNTQDKYYTYGLKLKHHASSASNDPQQALFSQNQIKAFGSREKGNKLSAEIDYQRNVVHYYGYFIDTPSLELGNINQIYNDINAAGEWSKKGKITSSIGLDFNIFDKLGENENTFSLTNNNAFKVGKGKLHIDVGATYTQLTEVNKYTRLFIDIQPHYVFKYKKSLFDIGFNINYMNDSNTNKIYPAPHIKWETYLVPKKLRAYAGVTGELKKNTLKSLSYENLFLGNNISYSNPYVWDIYAGMNGSFKRFVEYGIKLNQEFIKDQYLFVSDTNQLRNITTIVDDITKFTFSGEIKFDINKSLDIGFRGNVYSYNVNVEKEAWHLPSYDAAVFTTVRIADKIYIKGGYFATSTRKARDLKNTITTLKAINDINLGLEYRYKKNISGFINVNNILNQRYELWNNYRAQGLNVLAGVTFSL